MDKRKSEDKWIGVDLDGTLAEYGEWTTPDNIGKPVPLMMDRVKNWLNMGLNVKIFTARCCVPEHIPYVKKWLEKYGLGNLEVTNVKDYNMIELWDDRAIRIEKNTGRII